MAKKQKVWKYHRSHTFKHNGKKISFVTQLYQIGVYGIVNSDSSYQVNLKPGDICKMEKMLKTDLDAGKITDLEFGASISVTTDDDGFYVEFKE